jgi:dolichyldiphosphatase
VRVQTCPTCTEGALTLIRRFYLLYHTSTQVLAGAGIGVLFGTAYYTFVELLPARYPTSPLGQLRAWLVGNPLSTWIRLRDGWGVWADGGNEEEWKLWRGEWERQRSALAKRKAD